MSATTDSTQSPMETEARSAGFPAPAGQIDSEHGQIRRLPTQLLDSEVPAVRGVRPAVHKHEPRQWHGRPFKTVNAKPHRRVRGETARPDST